MEYEPMILASDISLILDKPLKDVVKECILYMGNLLLTKEFSDVRKYITPSNLFNDSYFALTKEGMTELMSIMNYSYSDRRKIEVYWDVSREGIDCVEKCLDIDTLASAYGNLSYWYQDASLKNEHLADIVQQLIDKNGEPYKVNRPQLH